MEFTAVPCVNPVGYVRDTRENGGGVDVNRSFEGGDVPEAQLLKKALEGCRVDAFVDCHEDWEADGFYMYEGPRQGPAVGPAVIAAVEGRASIDPDSGEDSEPVSRGGVRDLPVLGPAGAGAPMSCTDTLHGPASSRRRRHGRWRSGRPCTGWRWTPPCATGRERGRAG